MVDPNAVSWRALPSAVQHDLAPRGYGAAWFEAHDVVLRLTLLNVYRKLVELRLWQFVASASTINPGNLEYRCTDIETFKSCLRGHSKMTSPSRSMKRWTSREDSARLALHLKHFAGWPVDKVQAHIDPFGFAPIRLAGRISVVSPLQLVRHIRHYRGYMDAVAIHAQLNAQLPGLEVLGKDKEQR